jgi:acyl carrier protein
MTDGTTRTNIVFKIKEVLINRFGFASDQLDENSKLRDLGVDSMHIVEIMMDMEADLGMKLEDLSVPPNPSLGEVVDAIARNLPTPTSSS